MWNFDPGGMEATSNDLPLMSNISDIRVKHYLLDLEVNVKDRVFSGSTTLFLEQPASSRTKTCETGLLPLACDLSGSCPHLQGVSDEIKVGVEGCGIQDVKTASAPVSQEYMENIKSLMTKSSFVAEPGEPSQLKQASDPSGSYPYLQGINEEANIVDEWSGKEDVKTTHAHVSQELVKIPPCIGAKECEPLSLSSGSDESVHVDGTDFCSERQGFNQSLCQLGKKVMGVDKVLCGENSKSKACEATINCSEIQDGSDQVNKLDNSHAGSKSDQLRSSCGNINEDLPPCKRIENDIPNESKVCSTFEQSLSHLSGIEAERPLDKDFVMILDCCDIDIQAVEEVVLDKSKFGINIVSSGETEVGNSDVHLPLKNKRTSDMLTDKKSMKISGGQAGTTGKSLAENLCFKPSEYSIRRERFLSCQLMERRPLEFKVEPWCLRVWKRGVTTPGYFPAAICICYKTRPSGKSLTWAVDQDGRPCVFTQGAWINNRSLFPCQEPPGAMATWQAIIHAPEDLMVVMSGDEEGRLLQKKEGIVSSLHFTDMLQPSSIVTLAIGGWRCYSVPVSQPVDLWQADKKHLFSLTECKVGMDRASTQSQCNHDEWPCRIGCCDQPIIPSRIIAPPSVMEAAVKEFATYLPKCLHAVFCLLGPHPFSRLDVLVLPRCFASLGLASPSLIFVSQSLLSGDGSFLPRLAHEISHSWFGILIGAKDWTEEWLSEGFATFMEDPIHAVAQNWTSKQYQDHSRLKALLRYKALKAELENTESELQIMRPMAEGPGTSEGGVDSDVGFVKNGLNPDKWFLQVHYLKGYFFLHHIASHLSMEKTLQFINLYVMRYHGQLVLSKDIFQLLFDEYPELKDQGVTMENIYLDWLDKAGMPGDLNPESYHQGNALISDVMAEVERWKAIDKFHQKSNKRKRIKMSSELLDHSAVKLLSDQLILLLEGILDSETIATKSLEDINTTYCLTQQNAEVRHRWCELIIKHRFTKAYPDVRHFLMEDQAMGVYLYGELMASEDAVQQELARDCFKSVAMEIDRGCYRTVHEMVYGEPAEREDI